jgi:ferredoxin-NADP reductase
MRLGHQQAASMVPMKLIYSARSYIDMAYKYELFPPAGEPSDDVVMTFTEAPPVDWQGYARRIDSDMIEAELSQFSEDPRVYVCGITPFVEVTTRLLVEAGLNPARISAERFGATA